MKLKTLIKGIKIILEVAIVATLLLAIIYVIQSKDGVLSKIQQGTAKEKLDDAIKIFSITDGTKLEDTIKEIEGLENLEINEETGEYKMKIDGEEFMVVSKEILAEEER